MSSGEHEMIVSYFHPQYYKKISHILFFIKEDTLIVGLDLRNSLHIIRQRKGPRTYICSIHEYKTNYLIFTL